MIDTWQVCGLVERVLTLAGRLGHERVVCILDQNLTYGAAGHYLGTDLVRQLRSRGFVGVCVVQVRVNTRTMLQEWQLSDLRARCARCAQSANDAPEDAQLYIEAGADGSMGKAVKGGVKGMVDVVGRVWLAKFG